MESLILVLHIVVCVLLVILVLLQSGKEGMGVIFGGGNTSVFGSTGAGSLLAKMTAFMAVIFVCTSLAYTYVTSEHVDEESAVLNVRIEDPLPATTPAPQAPASSSPRKVQGIWNTVPMLTLAALRYRGLLQPGVRRTASILRAAAERMTAPTLVGFMTFSRTAMRRAFLHSSSARGRSLRRMAHRSPLVSL